MSSMQFSCAKIRMKLNKAIGRNDINRLLDANSYEDAKQVLVDIGFMPSVNESYELYADKILQRACKNIAQYCADDSLCRILLMSYDAHNLKMLIKARILGIEAENLYNNSIYKLNDIRHAVINHNYGFLPVEFKNTMNRLESLLISDVEPFMIDAMIDRALYAYIFRLLDELKYPVLDNYFTKMLYFVNVITVLRVKQMGKNPEILNEILLENKYVNKDIFVKSYNSPQMIYNKLINICRPFAKEYIKYINSQISLQELERTKDNELLACFKSVEYKLIDSNIFQLYLLKIQRSLLAIRLIMSVKASGLNNDKIIEKMRDLDAR